MIQELLGSNNNSVGIINGERSKLSSTCGGNLNITSPSPSPSPSSSTPNAANIAPPTPESLRCPRCDSANTKFCYYNNYNLTQPRHFCKTCRRYWTKGGALRNVPIGGGCRKNKSATITSSAVKQNSVAKFKTISQEIGKSNLFTGFEQTDLLSPNPMLWSSPQNSHLLSLLRSNQNQNQNPNPNPSAHMQNHVKEEGLMFSSRGMGLGLDNLGPFGLGSSNSFYRNNQGILLGEVQSNNTNGLQELYQRLRPPTSYADHVASHVTSGSTSAILDSAPVAVGDQYGFWNPTLSWSNDLSATNGAYH